MISQAATDNMENVRGMESREQALFADLKAQGMSESSILSVYQRMKDYIDPPEVVEGSIADTHTTELGLARRFITRNGHRVRHVPAWGSWLVWTGTHWQKDELLAVEKLMIETALRVWDELRLAKGITDDAQAKRKDLAQFAKSAENSSKQIGALKLVKPQVPVRPEDLDKDPWALAARNGVVDLRTGRLRRHDPADLITKLIPVAFEPASECPRWTRFIGEITDHDQQLAAYLQKVSGISLTGDVSEQVLFVFHGDGSNGKSVFVDTLLGILGDYACQSAPDLLTAKRNSDHPTDIAHLCGRRLVVTSETEDGATLRLQLLKRLTGDARITARYMRQDFFTFDRTHKTILVTNNRPIVPENTHAAWRRVKLVPFSVTIPEDQQDKRLLDALRAEWPGILAWAVRGCLAWQAEGLGEPTTVTTATDLYRGEADPTQRFFDQGIMLASNAVTPRDALFNHYQAWCDLPGNEGVAALSKNKFLDRVRHLAGVADGGQQRIDGHRKWVLTGVAPVTLSQAVTPF